MNRTREMSQGVVVPAPPRRPDRDAPMVGAWAGTPSAALPAQGDGLELELKFALSPVRGDEIIGRLAAVGAKPVARKLRSIYFDAPDHALRRAGFTLRVRGDGGHWVQTVKSRRANVCAGRGEWEAVVEQGVPDLALVGKTPAAAAMAGSALKPQFTVDVERRSVVLVEPGCVIEASFDDGEVKRARRAAHFSELEFELKSGDRSAFFASVGRLRDAFALRPSFATKADRGFALISGGGCGARHFHAPALRPEMTTGGAFRAIAVAGLEQIVGNAQILCEKSDAEAVHQMRTGVRRLRSFLRIFSPILADSHVDGVGAELKQLATGLDLARNLDVVLSGDFWRTEPDGAPTSDRSALERRLQAMRRTAYAQVRADVRSDRFSGLLFDTLCWAEAGPWSEPSAENAAARDRAIGEFAAEALEKKHRALMKQARDFKILSRRERHTLRIRIKTLRYGAEALGGLFDAHPKRARRFMARIKVVLDRLGALNDIATGEAFLKGATARSLSARRAADERLLLRDARKALVRFEAAGRFWPRRRDGTSRKERDHPNREG